MLYNFKFKKWMCCGLPGEPNLKTNYEIYIYIYIGLYIYIYIGQGLNRISYSRNVVIEVKLDDLYKQLCRRVHVYSVI